MLYTHSNMRLTRFEYTDSHWTLEPLEMGPTTLLVGNNTTGKSRTLAMIDLAARLISTSNRELLQRGAWGINLVKEDAESLQYYFEYGIKNTQIVIKKEDIFLGGRITGEVLLRNYAGDFPTARILNQNFKVDKQWEVFDPPSDKLTPQVRRDKKAYPFLEDIVQWAENTHSFAFANTGPLTSRSDYRIYNANGTFPVRYAHLSRGDQQIILDNLIEVGFKNIEHLSVEERGPDDAVMIIKEKGVERKIVHDNFSQGLSRALSLIIYLQQLIRQNTFPTLLIDDLCEGMDFDRARKLGKLVFEKCAKNNIQLIATSNDNFLMDVVDLDSLMILQREGSIVKPINRSNHPKLFEEFELTGFSNFDLYSSSFLAQHNL